MNNNTIATRCAEKRDEPMLKALWKTVFGDSDADIAHFFSTWFLPERTIVIDDDNGTPVSAAYILPIGALVLPDGTRMRCAMLYAIATLPAYRGFGFGEAVTRAAAGVASQNGFSNLVLKPASDSLFGFYDAHSEFREFFGVYETAFSKTDITPPVSGYEISPVTPEEYRRLRNDLLTGHTYIDMDEHGLSYQHYLCKASGGGLYALTYHGCSVGCSVIERVDDVITLKELLLKDYRQIAVALMAFAPAFPSEKYIVRTPYPSGPCDLSQYHRFGMALGIPNFAEATSIQFAKWYGLAFD